MTDLLPWLRPVLDGGLIVLLGVIALRLGRDPTAPWREREDALREIAADLRALVARAEGLASEMNTALGESARRVRAAFAAGGATAIETAAPSRPELTRQVEELAAQELPIEEISRRLGRPAAEVRLLVALARSAETTGQNLPGDDRTPGVRRSPYDDSRGM